MRIAELLAAGCLVALSASPALAQSMSSSTYVMKAGAGDLYERESSKLVAGSTTNADLKSFAQMMVSDHTKSTAMVKAAAMKSKLHPKPPRLDAKQSSDLAALRAARGSDRDALYISQQKVAHQDALMLQQDEAANGTSKPLMMAAGKIVPVVQHHIEMLNGM